MQSIGSNGQMNTGPTKASHHAHALTETTSKEYAQKNARRQAEAEQKRIADFRAVQYDDMSWFAAICNNATTIFPLTKEEKANSRRRYKKKWAMQKTQKPLKRIHRVKDPEADLTWFTHLLKSAFLIYPMSAEENANRKRRIKVNWTLTKKYGPTHWKNITPHRKKLYDLRKK